MIHRIAWCSRTRSNGAKAFFSTMTACCVALVCAAPVHALDVADYRIDGRCQAVMLSGDIAREESAAAIRRIVDAAERCGTRIIVMSKMPGGSVIDAIYIGSIIRAREYVTAMLPDSVCASACGLIYVGGTQRFWRSGGRFVIHRPEIRASFKTPADELQAYENLRTRLAHYISTMGGNPDYVDAMYAVRPGGYEQLDERDLTRLGLVTAVGSPFVGR
jgi:hypothetical protein